MSERNADPMESCNPIKVLNDSANTMTTDISSLLLYLARPEIQIVGATGHPTDKIADTVQMLATHLWCMSVRIYVTQGFKTHRFSLPGY